MAPNYNLWGALTMKKLISILLLVSMLSLCLAACNGNDETTEDLQQSDAVKYDRAIMLLAEDNYREAYALFSELGNYRDAADYVSHFHFIPSKLVLSDGEMTQEMRTTLNEQNLPKEIFCSFEEDEQLFLTLYFDQNGKLIKTTQPLEGEQEAATNYIYNDNGKLIKIDSYNHKDYTEYTYDDSGKLVKMVYINSNPGKHDIYEYFYNESGLLIKETYRQGPDSKVSVSITYTYDASNKLIKEVHTEAVNTSLSSETQYTYDESERLVKKVQTRANDQQTTSEYFYNEDGVLCEIKETMQDYTFTQKIEYTLVYFECDFPAETKQLLNQMFEM